MEGLRQRKALKVVKELDAFPKVPESYQETTATGGGVSIVVFLIIGVLVVSEIRYYAASKLHFDYDIDEDYSGKLKLNIDMTVAMRCSSIGADVLDLTGQNAESFGHLKEEDVHFELTPKQRQHFEMTQNINTYIKNEYHAIHDFLWKTGFNGLANPMPDREVSSDGPPGGCRLHGSLEVNKVAGNFHITAGKSIPVIPRGHAHLALMVRESEYNFSHRIDQFSFGEYTPGIINPLDGEEKIAEANYHMFQYFIQVVPTNVKTTFSSLNTFQYAVTERDRKIDHGTGSHGVPGIFVKYDLSPLKVTVREERKPYWQFLVRLCGIVGGIFATSGMLHGLMGFLVDIIYCRFRVPVNLFAKQSEVKSESPPASLLTEENKANPVQLMTHNPK